MAYRPVGENHVITKLNSFLIHLYGGAIIIDEVFWIPRLKVGLDGIGVVMI